MHRGGRVLPFFLRILKKGKVMSRHRLTNKGKDGVITLKGANGKHLNLAKDDPQIISTETLKDIEFDLNFFRDYIDEEILDSEAKEVKEKKEVQEKDEAEPDKVETEESVPEEEEVSTERRLPGTSKRRGRPRK